ncbi:MAG: hypothetical protein IT292_03565 [Deltaproteobacteria bacterium]|nr:hypothetical protein [Deltaproteobacteria bacterium]
MSSATQNKQIAKIIVGAMTIDGSLSKDEREKVAQTLNKIGMGELIGDVGAAIEEDDGAFNLIQETNKLMESLESDAEELAPLIFRVVTDVIASDRFMSIREASYLNALAPRLGIGAGKAKNIIKQILADRRCRLEASGFQIDAQLNPRLKDLLSFQGADKLVGEADPNSVEEMFLSAKEAFDEVDNVSHDDLLRALTVLGLDGKAKLEDAEAVWKETIDNLNLPKMAGLGETFVSAAINRITRINEAYKTVLNFHQKAEAARRAVPI